MKLRLAWYGDDFTGASDTLATVAAAGWRTVLFPRVPNVDQLNRVGPLDALGVAGTARALGPEAQQLELTPVRAMFAALQPPITLYKCCSTFDSAPHVGNLALGLQALRTDAHQPWVPIVGGQPSLGRYCAFGELYATASAEGEVFRIDRHPTMCHHPVTPMHEADLRRHLIGQGLSKTGLIDLRVLDTANAMALETALDTQLRASPDAVLFDATCHTHLARIGGLLWRRSQKQPLLALGSSSVAQALIARSQGLVQPPPHPCQVAPAQGPVLLMVGSLSPVTAAQVAAASDDYVVVDLPVGVVVTEGAACDALVQRCARLLAEGHSVLARTTSDSGAGADQPPAAQSVAEACGRWLLRALAAAPQVRRVGVAGGDTSSFALRALDPWALRWAGSLALGVHVLRVHSDNDRFNDLELMLKGGQMGPPDVFRRLIRGMHTDARQELAL